MVTRTNRASTAELSMGDFWADSEQLEEFSRQDYSSLVDEMQEQFPETWEDMMVRAHPVAWRTERELGCTYDIEPIRNVDAGRKSQSEAIEGIYAREGYDIFNASCAQSSISQRSMIRAFTPRVRWEGEVVKFVSGRFRFERFHPWQVVSVLFDDPMETDIRMASYVELEVPRHVTDRATGREVKYARRVYTPTEAYVVDLDGSNERPLFGESKAHGFGYIPLTGVRLGDEMKSGFWFPRINEPLLLMQVAACLDLSDIRGIARIHTYPHDYLKGKDSQGTPLDWTVGPSRIRPLPDETEIQRVASKPHLDEYLNVMATDMGMFASESFMDAKRLHDSSGITGAAKEVEQATAERELRRGEKVWRAAEQDMATLVADTLNRDARRIADPINRVKVEIDYRYFTARQNDLQKEQAFALRCANGADSPEERAAREDGVPLPAEFVKARLAGAGELVALRIRKAKEHGLGEAAGGSAGADRIARQINPVGRPGAGQFAGGGVA